MHNDEIGIVTRSGGRRLRWSAAAVAVPLFGVVAAFGTVEHGREPIPTRIVVDPLALSATPVGDRGTIIYFQEDRSRSGDTVATLIERLGADEDEAVPLLRSSRAARPFRLLLPGTTVKAKVDDAGKLRSLWFLSDRDTILSVDRLGESFGSFEQQAFCLARLEPFVHGLERELDGDRSIGADFVQDRLSPGDEFRRRNDLVDESDAISLLRVDHLAR